MQFACGVRCYGCYRDGLFRELEVEYAFGTPAEAGRCCLLSVVLLTKISSLAWLDSWADFEENIYQYHEGWCCSSDMGFSRLFHCCLLLTRGSGIKNLAWSTVKYVCYASLTRNCGSFLPRYRWLICIGLD